MNGNILINNDCTDLSAEGYAALGVLLEMVWGIQTMEQLNEWLALAEEDAFVIGGASIYQAMLPYCDKVYLTKVYADAEADVFFPSLCGWQVVRRSEMQEENGLRFQYIDYMR